MILTATRSTFELSRGSIFTSRPRFALHATTDSGVPFLAFDKCRKSADWSFGASDFLWTSAASNGWKVARCSPYSAVRENRAAEFAVQRGSRSPDHPAISLCWRQWCELNKL